VVENGTAEFPVYSFLLVFHSNYTSILLSFRDLNTRRTTDGETLATNAYLALETDQQL